MPRPGGVASLRILHIALGGCLKAPPVTYGITGDTGGHIAYVLEAAIAQAEIHTVSGVTIVTRLFDTPSLGAIHACDVETIDDKVTIQRIATANRAYLEKGAIAADLDAFTAAFLAFLEQSPRPDVIHAHFADAASVAEAARERFGIPYFYTPHALGMTKQGRGETEDARIAAERAALRDADGVIVSSHDEAERQIATYDLGVVARVHRIAPGVPRDRSTCNDADAMLAAHLDEPRKAILLAVARPVRKKNLVALARAYAETPALREAANFVLLAGQHGRAVFGAEERGVVADLTKILADPALRGRVAFPERHTSADVHALYRRTRDSGGLFVNPALQEPFGLTLLEAAAAGLPVVATRNGGAADIVAEIGHGLLVDPHDPSDIAGACLRVLQDRALHRRFSQAALRNHGRFSWSRYARESVALYAAAIQPARPPRQPSRRDADQAVSA